MKTTRRSVLAGLGAGAGLAPFLSLASALAKTETTLAEANANAEKAHQQLMAIEGMHMHGSEQIAMLLYPQFTALDLVGPQYMFASMMGATVHLVTNQSDLSPVMSDTGLAIAPTITMADCPADLDLIFVPGGTAGTLKAMQDEATLNFLKDRVSRASHITSVCTGSLVLGMAGLLEGKKATSHWRTRHFLSDFGAEPVDARVVVDGPVITGAGVTAGIDFGLAVIAAMRGKPYAQGVQLIAEYAPEPPLQSGTPDQAEPELRESISGMFAGVDFQMREVIAARYNAN